MPIKAVASPALDADPIILADWLELTAFFDPDGRARLDEIDNAASIQQEEYPEDNGSADAERDERREAIENEIVARADSLDDAYPFELSEDGEELRVKPKGQRRGLGFYLSSLVISHFKNSEILVGPPSDQTIASVRRRQFQTFATLAVAGHVRGPAISFGWPRISGETMAEALARFCAGSGTGTLRAIVGPEAEHGAKDGGMDVIAWRTADNDVPPPAMVYFGQAASGAAWSGKSANDDRDQFLEAYFEHKPACSTVAVTIVPFRLTPDELATYSRRHGHILDRLRAPRAAMTALTLAKDEDIAVDEVNYACGLLSWLIRYRNSARADA